MPLKVRLFGSCFLTLLLCVACPAQDAAPEPPAVEVKLLDAGKSPREAIRIKATKGNKQTTVMTMKLGQKIVVRGLPIPAPDSPAMQFTIDVNTTDVAENGDTSFEFVYSKIDLVDDEENPSPIAAQLKGFITSLKGMSGSATIDNRGFIKESEINLPPNVAAPIATMLESMQDSMKRISSPLPEEPVGVGAKWLVTQQIKANGLSLTQTSTQTITEIKDGKYEIAIEQAQSAEPQDVEAPGLPEGTSLKLISLESTGTGKSTYDTAFMFPITTLNSDSKVSMEMSVAGQVQPMQVETKLLMTIAEPASK